MVAQANNYYFYQFGMRIVLSVFFLVWVCVVLVWDYACRPGVKTNTMAALVRVRSVVIRGSNQHHHRRRDGHFQYYRRIYFYNFQ